MKVYKGVMYRIIIEMACGCQSKQEFKDDLLREADGSPIYIACEKHGKSKLQAEMMEIILMEALEKEATDAKNAATMAAAQANRAELSYGPPIQADPVGEGSASETSSPLVVKVGNKIVNKSPAGAVVHQQTPAANLPTARPNPVRSNKVNLSGGPAASGLRRAAGSGTATSTAQIIAQKKANLASEAGGGSLNIDIDAAPAVSEDERITQLLVDDPDGGLLGDPEGDPSRV